jgi:hypothetical protein
MSQFIHNTQHEQHLTLATVSLQWRSSAGLLLQLNLMYVSEVAYVR